MNPPPQEAHCVNPENKHFGRRTRSIPDVMVCRVDACRVLAASQSSSSRIRRCGTSVMIHASRELIRSVGRCLGPHAPWIVLGSRPRPSAAVLFQTPRVVSGSARDLDQSGGRKFNMTIVMWQKQLGGWLNHGIR